MAPETEHRWRVLEFEAASPQIRSGSRRGPTLAGDPTAWSAWTSG